MARETHSGDTAIDQPRNLVDLGDLVAALKGREPEIVEADPELSQEYLAELAFMNEWVKIRIDPSSDENAPTTFPVWCNGRGAEILINGRPVVWTHLPIGPEITVRRSVVEIIARSKTMRVATNHQSGGPDQQVSASQWAPTRRVSQTQPFSVISDPSPRGSAWVAEMIRRAF